MLSIRNRGIIRFMADFERPHSGTDSDTPRLWWVAAFLLVMLFLLLNHRLLSGDYSAILDADQEFIPYYTLIADHARAGRLMTWNLYMHGGEPTGFDPQAGAFSPLHLAVGLLVGGVEGGFRLIWLLFWGAGALGVLLLGRHWQAGPWGSLAVALGYAFSGMYIGQAQHTPLLYTMSVFPWVLWRFDVGLQKRSWLPVTQAGALLGMSGLGGYPILTMLGGVFLALWALGYAVSKGFEKDVWWHAVLATALAGIVCAIVFAPGVLGLIYETQGFSDRGEPLARDWVIGSNTMVPGAFVTILNPVFGMLPFYNPGIWKGLDWSFAIQYAGGLIPILALVAVCRKRAWRSWWVLGMLALFTALSLGTTLPLRGWLYDAVAATRYWRNPVLFQSFYFICVSVLALWGLKELNRGVQSRRLERRFPILSGLFLAAGIGAMAVCFDRYQAPELRFTFGARLQLLLVLGGLTVAFAWVSFKKPVKTTHWLYAALVGLAFLDAFATLELNHTVVAKPAPEWQNMAQTHDARIDQTQGGLGRRYSVDPVYTSTGEALVNNKNIPRKQPTLKGITALRNRFHDAIVQDETLYSYALGEARIWFAPNAVEARPTDGVFNAFLRRSKQLARPPLVVHSPAEMLAYSRKDQAYPGDAVAAGRLEEVQALQLLPVDLHRYGSDELEFETNTPAAGWVVVTDRWSRSWQATVDGRPVESWGANFIFRALPVKAGRQRIRYTFDPPGYPEIVVVSWAMLACVGVASLVFRLWRRRESISSAEG